MSVEIHVLFHGTLPTKAALTRAMKELGFPLTISPPGGSLEQQSGFMPMRFRREESGVEFDVFNDRADIEALTRDLAGDIDPRFDRSANFRWGGDENEMVCGVCAAAALARLVNGVVLEDGEPLAADKAITWAKKHLHDATPPDRRGGTRPADVKRYLKALLKERNDLALVGRLLVVRPVRHLLRGAYFESHGRDQFRVWCHVNPLYAPAATTYGNYWHVAGCYTWEPHFEPLLIDALAEDVFTKVGRVLTLNDFAAQSFDLTPFLGAQIVSWVLAGDRDRAAAFVGQIENDESINAPAKELVKRTWGSVSGDIERICADRHIREAAAVKDLQLEHIWEPSPFPVELSAAERERRTAEPLFVPTPWISRPEWLLQDPPDHLGDVRYARERLFRGGAYAHGCRAQPGGSRGQAPQCRTVCACRALAGRFRPLAPVGWARPRTSIVRELSPRFQNGIGRSELVRRSEIPKEQLARRGVGAACRGNFRKCDPASGLVMVV
jgi:hypothetical protein